MENSTSQAQEEQAYIAVVESNFTTNLCLFSAVALYCFDFTLTFAQQVRFLRGRRFSFPTLLFLLLHITGCLTLVATPAAMFAPPCESYFVLMIISGATATLFEVLTAIITVLRVYAISGRNRLVTAVLVLLFLVEIGYDIHGNTLARLNMADDCLLSYGLITPMLNDWNIASTATIIAAHILTIVVTWRNTYTLKRLASTAGQPATITTLILRDGTIIFGTVLAIDIIQAAIWTLPSSGFDNLAIALMTITLSRFFLHLSDASTEASAGSQSSVSELHFQSVERSFGGNMVFEHDTE